MDDFSSFVEAVRSAEHCVVLTGAGASTESGLPDFRSKQGLWQGVEPMKLASMTALRTNPVEFYQFYQMRLSKLHGAAPNRVHYTLAALEREGFVKAVITQNIDGLHQLAGSTTVIEAHGSLRSAVCLDCQHEYPSAALEVPVTSRSDLPRCKECRGMLKPGVILFEEALPMDAIMAAHEHALRCDLFVVIGSSLEVAPVNLLPQVAVANGARLAIINLEPTSCDRLANWVFQEQAGSVLNRLHMNMREQ